MHYLQGIASAVVIAGAITFLFVWHHRTWKARKSESTNENELRFHKLQYRRRLQTTAMMGFLAVMLFVGNLLEFPGWLGVLYWGTAFFLAVWLIFLGFGDVAATRIQVARSQQALLMECAKLQREINDIRRESENTEKSD